MILSSDLQTSLKRRLLFWVWLVTSVSTFIFTSVQLYIDYKEDESAAVNQVKIIYENHLPSITQSLWDYNLAYTKIHCDSILNLNHVSFVSIQDDDDNLVCQKEMPDTQRSSLSKFDYIIEKRGEKIGQLHIGLDLAALKAGYFAKGVRILLTQALKTLIVCWILFIVFETLIMKHLHQIVAYFKDFDAMTSLPLDLERGKSVNDDFTVMEKSINELRASLRAKQFELLETNRNLEKIVEERTSQRDRERLKTAESSRLASLGLMATGVAHEINNPLSIIAANTHLMKKRLLSQNKNMDTEAFDVIEEATVRISRITTGLRTLARADRDKISKGEFELEKIVDDFLQINSEFTKEKNISVQKIGFSGQERVFCDNSLLARALLNVFSNAIDAVSTHEGHRWIRFMLLTKNGDDYIKVFNSGPVMTEATKAKLFTPFFTTKDIGKGTGLGLSVAKSLMEKQSGDLYLEDTTDWTTFIFKLPKKKKALVPVTETKAS